MSLALKPAPPDVAAQAASQDVVLILGYTSWSGAARRGWIHAEDRLTLALMRSTRVRRLVVCNPYRSVLSKVVRVATGSRDAAFPETSFAHLHEPLRLRRADPTHPRAIARSCAAYEKDVQRGLADLHITRPAVITTHPLLSGFGTFDWAGPVTYFANDDPTACPPLRRWWPAYDKAFSLLRQTERRAVALTPRALASISPMGRSAVIPCGIEPAEWLTPRQTPAWFATLPSPKLLYVGTLDPRLDVEALRRLAWAYPQGSIVLMGPCPDPDHLASLRHLPNVKVRPPVDRAELRGLVRGADVGLIPHVVSAQTKAMSPLKLYEYLAAGLPVASIELPGVTSVRPDRTALARRASEFPDAVSRALDLGRWDEQERLDFVHQNAWERRFADLLDVALER